MNRLCTATLGQVPPTIVASRNRAPIATGIVHFGPGAFHRAHQAAYIDALLDTDPRWGIAAVSLRTRGTVDAMAAQDGLYTLAVRDAVPSYRVIGAHTRFLGPDDAAETLALLADPAVGIVTTTVTEKGYCLTADGALNFAHPDIVHDLAAATPRSVIGWIVAGLAVRRTNDCAPYVVIPCDNLADNGGKLRAALVAFATARDAALAAWIDAHVRVPATMVDSITPASDDALLADVAGTLTLTDDAAVQREGFTQWVIEDVGNIGPDLASVGATITRDVAAYERAKLRILNGAHSTLAYAGLLRGHAAVADAMDDEALARFVTTMIDDEIAPMLTNAPGLDLSAYARDVLARFRNPAIIHRLDQIAQDGTQKIPYRLGDTLAAHRKIGSMPRRVVAAIGCWAAFVLNQVHEGVPILDPAATTLVQLAAGADPATFVQQLAEHDCGIPRAALGDAELLAALQRAAQAAVAREWQALGL